MALDTSKLVLRRWLGKPYYRVEDVDALLAAVNGELEQYEGMPQKLEDLAGENEALKETCANVREENVRLTRQLQAAQQELCRKNDAAAEMEANLRRQIADQQDMLERARKREAFLNGSLEQQKKEIEDYERFANSDPVTQAYEKAQKILADAQAERERILQEYTQQRARVTAATRSAYYNALQFKMTLAKRFGEMEKNLDETIDVLRTLETSSTNGSPALRGQEQPAVLEEGKTFDSGADAPWNGVSDLT